MHKIFAAGVAALVAAPALAEAPAFSGPWVEARIGFDNVGGGGIDTSGFYYGGGFGYDFRLGSKVVAGAQAGISDSTAKVCGLGVCATADRDIEVLGRLGYVIGDSSLLYGLAGYANLRGSVAGLGGGNADGYRLGVGFEEAFSRHLFSRAEYRYSGIDGGRRHQITVSLGYRF